MVVRDVIDINVESNFQMHSWASNATSAIEAINESAGLGTEKTKLYSGDEERELGLYWDRKTDELGFNIGTQRIPEGIVQGSKRRKLSKTTIHVFVQAQS